MTDVERAIAKLREREEQAVTAEAERLLTDTLRNAAAEVIALMEAASRSACGGPHPRNGTHTVAAHRAPDAYDSCKLRVSPGRAGGGDPAMNTKVGP